MNSYQVFNVADDKDRLEALRTILHERRKDVKDFDELKNRFISVRKSGKIPTGSSDIDAKDAVGDMNYDANYLYLCVNDSGLAKWRRIPLTTW